jgi:hypothetical protein
MEYKVYPPRVLRPEAFPKVDALILTHEHDDHFDIPSLAKLDRRIPVFLSAHSSTAVYKILCEMGFAVNPLIPGVAFECGDLQVLPLCGDHVHTTTGDEWDTLPLVIRQAEGAGSFFTMVDCPMTAAHLALARTFVPQPGLISWTNNAQDWSHMIDARGERTQGTAEFATGLREGYGKLCSLWGQPAGVILCAGGFAFTGARKWLNKRIFCVDPERVVKAVSSSLPGQRFVAGRPGQTFYMQGNAVQRVEKQAPFLATASPNTWPAREKTPMTEFPDYQPATGRAEPLTEAELDRLRQRLSGFAGTLVGGPLFKNLLSILDIETEGRCKTFAFVLRQGAKAPPLTFLYNPSGCTFDLIPTVDNPRQVFLAGFECWAADLLAVLSGEMGAIALLYGRASLWNALPARFNFDLFGELMRESHPLRHPEEYLRTYQRILASCADTTPTIMHRGA